MVNYLRNQSIRRSLVQSHKDGLDSARFHGISMYIIYLPQAVTIYNVIFVGASKRGNVTFVLET